MVEHDGLVVACEHDLALGHDGVHVVPNDLALVEEGVGVDALEGGDLGGDALLHALVAEVGAPLPGGDGDPRAVGGRAKAHRAVADEDERPEVGLCLTIGAQKVTGGRHDLVDGVGDLQQPHVGALEEPADVLAMAEDVAASVGPLVAADALEHTEAVVERVGHDVDVGLVPGDQGAIHPDKIRAK